MLSGSVIRHLATGRIAAVIGGTLLTAAVMLWFWRPWAPRGPAGRVILAEPVARYDAGFVYTLPTPAAPDWQRTGEVVDCPVIEPTSRAAERELALFGREDLGHLLWLDEVGELPYGGILRVRRPEADLEADTVPLVEVELRPARPPLARWRSLHRFEGQIGVAALLSGVDSWSPSPFVGIRYRPGEGKLRRRWSMAPDFAGRYRLESGVLEVSAALTAGYCGGSDCR